MKINKKYRLQTIPRLDYIKDDITTIANLESHPFEVKITKSDRDERYFLAKELSLNQAENSAYHLPYLFHNDHTPWYEANLYIYRESMNDTGATSTTEKLRAIASRLLDFKVFCEEKNIDYLDLSAIRPAARPTYRYFNFLKYQQDISAKNLNRRTKAVYEFYKFLSDLPEYEIDLERVEQTKKAFLRFESGFSKQVELRSQTLSTTSQATPVPIGYVRDEGEDLRPLTNFQTDELINVLNREEFSVEERLLHLIALNTGARKQTIFTLRMKHLKMFSPRSAASDGTYMLKVGPGSGADTKFNKPQVLYFPKKLIDQIKVYANSKLAKTRRELFRLKHGDILNEDDMYVFLSSHGNCYYMAKDDPRYREVKSRPKGEQTDYLKRKLLKLASKDFPRDFRFHWLRATFAFKYYQYLAPLVVSNPRARLELGQLRPGDEIRKIQQRLHHNNRKTTEHYLKLFVNFDERTAAQELYEEHLFKGVGLSFEEKY